MPTHCDRCKKPLSVHTCSWFNTQEICMECSETEKNHPDCAYAKKIESQACAQGNYNFKGVGWPGVDGRVQQ
jgi:hypothetical protein